MINRELLRAKVLSVATQMALKGPRFAQSSIVLKTVARWLARKPRKTAQLSLELQQALLDCWNDLFIDGDLCRGWDFDNPSDPFFHIPVRHGRQAA